MKTFEEFWYHEKEFKEYVAQMCVECGWYIKESLPDEKFNDFLYSDLNYPIIDYTFFYEDGDKEFMDKLNVFMDKLNIKYTTSYTKSWQLDYDDDVRIYLAVKFSIHFDLVKEFGELNLSTNKYNL